MKKILFALLLLWSAIINGQTSTGPTGPTTGNYLQISSTGYNWKWGYFQALGFPTDAGAPHFMNKQFHGEGAVYVDSTAHTWYMWLNGAWVEQNTGGGGGGNTIYSANDVIVSNRTVDGGGNFLHFTNLSNYSVFSAANGYFQLSDSAAYVVGDTLVSIFTQAGAGGRIAILGRLFTDTYNINDSIVVVDAVSRSWKAVSPTDILTVAGSVLAVGNQFDIQFKKNGVFSTPGSDSLYYQSGLSVKGKVFIGPRLTSSTAKLQVSSDSSTQPLMHLGPPSLSVSNNLAWVNFNPIDSNVTTNSGLKAVGIRLIRKTIMGANGVGLNVRYGGGFGYEISIKDSLKLTPANSDGVAASASGWQFTKVSGQTTRSVIQSGTGTWDFTPTTLSTMQSNGGTSTNNFVFRGWFANTVAYLLSDNAAHTDSIEHYAGFTSTGAAASLGLKVAYNYDFFATGILGGDGSNIDSSWAYYQGHSNSTIVRNFFSGPTTFDPTGLHSGTVEAVEVYGSVKIVDGTQGAGKIFMSDANGKGHWQDTTGLFPGIGGGGSSLLPLTGTGSATGDIIGDLNVHTLDIANVDGSSISWGAQLNVSFAGTGGIILGASMIVEDDRGTPRGLEYDGDYSATFNGLSLVNKSYVLSLIASPFVLTSTVTTDVPLTLVGAASQTGHLMEFKNNAGTVVGYIGSGGGYKILGAIDNGYTGSGPEIEQNGAGQGIIRSYNRAGSYNDFIIEASTLYFAPGGTKLVNITSTGTYFGGVTAANSTLQIGGSVAFGYVAKTANYTATANDYLIDCTSNSFNVTLPTAVGITGRVYIIKNSGTATTITPVTTSGQTIDGAAPVAITTPVALRVMSNGANWIIF